MEKPLKVKAIRGGWAALGKGWAVFGETRNEALERFREARTTHAAIEARPAPNTRLNGRQR